MQVLTFHLCIRGRVQGVGFRDAMSLEARRLGVTGWVRNRGTGEVEALVQGKPADVDALVAWARRGPSMARVEELRCRPAPAGTAGRTYVRFERWPSE